MEEKVLAYLEELAKNDESFAKYYRESGKTFKGCIKWLLNYYQNLCLKSNSYGVVVTNNEDTFELAASYFTDESITEEKPKPAPAKESPEIPFTGKQPNAIKPIKRTPAKKIALKPAVKPAPATKPVKKNIVQLNLFDF